MLVHLIALLAPEAPGLPSDDQSRTFLFNLWQVAAATISIAFVILLLILESVNRASDSSLIWRRFSTQPSWYMSLTFLLGTIASIGLDALLMLPKTSEDVPSPRGLDNLLVLDVILFAMAIILIGFLYTRMFSYLHPRFVRHLARESTLDETAASIVETVRRMIQRSILREECKRLGFLNLEGTRSLGAMTPVFAAETGRISDISLTRLRALAQSLRAQGTSRAVITGTVGMRVIAGQDVVGLITAADDHPAIHKLAAACFRLGPKKMSDELHEAYEILTADGIRAIELRRSDHLNEVLSLLLEPMRLALEELANYGIRFDEKSSSQVFPFEWRALEKPFETYHRVLESVTRTSDRDLTNDVLYWPNKVLQLSLEANDHYFFRQATICYERFLFLSGTDVTPTAKRCLRYASWRFLNEFATYRLAMTMKEATGSELERLMSYGRAVLVPYLNLLRMATDTSDEEYWTAAKSGFWECLDMSRIRPNHDLEIDLAYSRTALEKSDAEQLLKLIDFREGMWFSLGAWAASRRLSGHVSGPGVEAVIRSIAGRYSGDFRSLWQAYNAAVSESQRASPISRWEFVDHREGGVWGSAADHMLTTFFVALALATASPPSFEALKSIRDPAQALWVQGLVDRALDDVLAHSKEWTSLIGTIDVRHQEPLKSLVSDAVAHEQQREEQAILEQDLSATKLRDFRNDLLRGWSENSLFRWIFAKAGRIQLHSHPHTGRGGLGFRRLLPKGYFVDRTGSTHYLGIGADFGRGMASGEDARAFSVLRRGAPRFRTGRKALYERLAEVIGNIRDEGLDVDAVIAVNGWATTRQLDGSPLWRPSYTLTESLSNSTAGLFDGVPVYNYYPEQPEANQLLVLSVRGGVAAFHQYLSPQGSIFSTYCIRSFVRTTISNELERDNSWLPDSLRGLPTGEAAERLVRLVDLRIEQQIDVKLVNRRARAVLVATPKSTGISTDSE